MVWLSTHGAQEQKRLMSYSPFHRSFLKEKRKEKGLSQQKVSEELQLKSPQFVSNVERGLCGIPIDQLKELIHIYELDEEEMIAMLMKAFKADLLKALKGK